MTTHRTAPRPAPPADLSSRRATLAVMLVVFACRLVHFAYASQSPLTYQIGPDEDYYLRFGLDVAFGSGGMTSEFAFMDPLYGYLLGAVLKFTGGSAFPMYVLQLLVDCGTAYGLVRIGRELDRPRAGLVAGLLYALVGPAMAFSTALLKATWVAAFVCWWIWFGLRLLRTQRAWAWLAFGAYCGLGVALRANLLLMVLPALVLLPWLHRGAASSPGAGAGWRRGAAQGALMAAGLLLPLLLLAARNHAIDARWSPVPTNGGVVLHQLYNPENPRSVSGVPSFVSYGHPSEIRRDYEAEAARRAGGPLTPRQVEGYWRREATAYLFAHPMQDVRNGLRKLAEASAYPEVPNNRSYADERRFSPLLRWLPQPFGWLFALGVPGLLLLGRQDRRAWLLLLPVAMGVATIAVFFAEDRFRFSLVAPFAFGAAAWLLHLWTLLRARRRSALALALSVSALLGAWSVLQARRIPPTPMDWQRIATGYFKMGDRQHLHALLRDVAATQGKAVGLHEFRGLVALADRDYPAARRELEAALAQRQDRHEVWHNYSVALQAQDDTDAALAAELRAYRIAPRPEYMLRIGELLEALGRRDEAATVYAALGAQPAAGPAARQAVAHLARLRATGTRARP